MSTITYERPRFWQRTWFLAPLLGVGVGIGLWWWQLPSHDAEAAQVPTASSAERAPRRSKVVDPALLVTPKVLEGGRPADFTPEDWAALKDAMSRTPNPRAELERVVKYLRFQKGFEQWQALQDDPDVAMRQKLAARLLEQVPERLKQGEMTYGEALMLDSALLADLEANEDVRKRRLEQAQALLNASVPRQDAEQSARDAAMLAEYKRREAAIMAAFQALPENKRDQAQLGRDLDSARLAVYGSKK